MQVIAVRKYDVAPCRYFATQDLRRVQFLKFCTCSPTTPIHQLYTQDKMVLMDYEPSAQGQESYILCADCGTVISSANGAGLCKSCLST